MIKKKLNLKLLKMSKTKEQKIQHCQITLANIEQVKEGLACMLPEVVPANYQLDDLFIECDPWVYEDMAQGIKNKHLKLYLEDAHNNYVAILAEMKKRKGAQLTKLLSKNGN